MPTSMLANVWLIMSMHVSHGFCCFNCLSSLKSDWLSLFLLFITRKKIYNFVIDYNNILSGFICYSGVNIHILTELE